MATVTSLGSSLGSNMVGESVTATPAVNDLIIIVTGVLGQTNNDAPTDNKGGTYTLITSCLMNSGTNIFQFHVRNQLISSAVSTTFSFQGTGGAAVSEGMQVFKVTGQTVAGLSAILQNANQANQGGAGSTTPAPAFASVPQSGNPVISGIFSVNNPPSCTVRTGYTQSLNGGDASGYGIETMFRNSGETSATITWGSAISFYCDIAIEVGPAGGGLPPGGSTLSNDPRVRAYAEQLRTWTNENANIFTNPFPQGKRTFELSPPARSTDIDLKTWKNENPNIFTNPFPHNQYDWPTPSARTIDVELKTWTNENPNLYTNPFPVGKTATDLSPLERPYKDTRTWINENPNIFTNPVPVGQIVADLSPPPRFYNNDLRTSVNENANIYTNPVPAGATSVSLTPLPRTYTLDLRTWINENPNIFTNPIPIGIQISDVPASRQASTDNRTWINSNPNIYVTAPTGPPPGIQAVDLTPNARPSSIDLRTSISGNNPSIYTNPIPIVLQTDWSVPPPRQTDIELKTWTWTNPSIYTNPVPAQQYNWPAPTGWTSDIELRTWTWANPSTYTNPQPFQQSNWPTPLTLARGIDLLSWTNQNANIYSGPPPTLPPGASLFALPVVLPFPSSLLTWTNENPNTYPPIPPPPSTLLPDHFIGIGLRITVS